MTTSRIVPQVPQKKKKKMNETETRADFIDPALKAAGWGVLEGKFNLLVVLFSLVYIVNSTAQPGSIDLSFNSADKGYDLGNGFDNTVQTSVIQVDGKIIVCGNFTEFNGTKINRIARLNTDGTLDTTFRQGVGVNARINTVIILSDGKIIIAGHFSSYDGTTRNKIARLNADGTLDQEFDSGIGANFGIMSISVQKDGKIIIGGDFTLYNGTEKKCIARLNSDGTLDDGFSPVFEDNNWIKSIVIQSDGKFLVGGEFETVNGISRNRIARLNEDGTLDDTFNPGAGVNAWLYSIAIQDDNKIILGGDFTSYNETARNRIVRVNTDGSIDDTFNPGTGANNRVYSIVIQNNGKIIISGFFALFNNMAYAGIARLNTDGSVDSSFMTGLGTRQWIFSIALQSDDKIIIGGDFTSFNDRSCNRINRLNNDGSIDIDFNKSTGANGSISSIVIQKDGRIIIGGDFTIFNGMTRNYIARLNTNGTLDTTYNLGAGANYPIRAIAIQEDGKIVIGGHFSRYNESSINHIARLNDDGFPDDEFKPGTEVAGHVVSIIVQNDGKIIVACNAVDVGRVIRLNADGSHDDTFDSEAGTDGSITTIALQSDGKIIVSGNFTTCNKTERKCIARLNSDGTLDETFNPGTGANQAILSTIVQDDGKILIGGSFGFFNGTTRNRIARLNPNGTLDTSFNPSTGANSAIVATVLQGDGKILIGGHFTIYRGTSRNRIARLNSNGTLDTSFDPDLGANSHVNSIAVQKDGNLIIGGDFTSYDGNGKNRIARIFNDVLLDIPLILRNEFSVYPNPVTNKFIIEVEDLSSKLAYEVYNASGQIMVKGDFIEKANVNANNYSPGIYFVKVGNDNYFQVKKIIKY
jgi:uncharacterized delta-60 repeat protein